MKVDVEQRMKLTIALAPAPRDTEEGFGGARPWASTGRSQVVAGTHLWCRASS